VGVLGGGLKTREQDALKVLEQVCLSGFTVFFEPDQVIRSQVSD
jgi:hypothetical protein